MKTDNNYTDIYFFGKIKSTIKRRTQDVNYYHWFPTFGLKFRELKFTTEKYFRNEITADELLAAAKDLRAKHWNIVKEKGITEIPSNDFSHYDNFLDAAFLFNVVPESVKNLDLTELEQYFALARGYQGEKGGCACSSNEEMVQHQLPLHRSKI